MHTANKPIVIISATSDLATDQRVHRNCLALEAQGFDIFLVGRELPDSPPVPTRNYRVKRFRLWFTRGPLFYASYNLRLFIFLISSRYDVLFANDLDTLSANFLASKIKGGLLVYDSHEYYTGVPELENRPLVRSIWKWIESYIFPKLKFVITVNSSIAGMYEKEYGNKIHVIRNVPLKPESSVVDKSSRREKLHLPAHKKIIILQGSGINIERGAEEAVEAMRFLDENYLLIILGGGDALQTLKEIYQRYQLQNRVMFLPRMPFAEMMSYTRCCDLGLTLDKNTNLNYRFSLPNKIFDYIHAGIPVLASRLPEVARVIDEYGIGGFIDNHEPEHIARRIQSLLADHEFLARCEKNLQIAASQLHWEEERKKFPDIIHEIRK